MFRVVPAAFLALLIAFAIPQRTASAAEWPDRPIHFIVPFTAGSSSDIVARIVAQKLGERLGQQLVVDNRPGASGSLGAEAIARADSDGYTLGLVNASLTVAPSVIAQLNYDPIRSFSPISMIGASPYVMAAYPGLPIRNIADLITRAKAEPGKLTYAEAGPATLAGLAGVLLTAMARIELTPVAYRGSSSQEALDVIEGRIDLELATIPPTLHLIREGKVRALAVTGLQRSPILPEVPTVAESGLPGYEAVLWQAICAPAGTPPEIVSRLNREVNDILHDQSVDDALGKLGVEPAPGSPAELAARIAADIKKWHDVIQSAGIKLQ